MVGKLKGTIISTSMNRLENNVAPKENPVGTGLSQEIDRALNVSIEENLPPVRALKGTGTAEGANAGATCSSRH